MLPGHTAFSFAMSINRRFYEEEGKNIPRAVSAPQKERDVFNTCAARSGADSHSARRLRTEMLFLGSPWITVTFGHPKEGAQPGSRSANEEEEEMVVGGKGKVQTSNLKFWQSSWGQFCFLEFELKHLLSLLGVCFILNHNTVSWLSSHTFKGF